MNTPVFQQLTGLLAYLKAQLRADSYLVSGVAVTDCGYDADQVCKTVYPHKLFEVQGDGVTPYVDFGKVNAPALAVYVEKADFESVNGSMGMVCDIGIQYAFQTRARDVSSQAFAAHFAMSIWWAICQIVQADFKATSSSLRDTYHIEGIGLDGMRLLPPFSQAIRAFEAGGTIEFKRPLWDTGADSSQVVDLASIYTDHNETGDMGGVPLTQSIYEP